LDSEARAESRRVRLLWGMALAFLLLGEEFYMEMTATACDSNMSDLWAVMERFARDHEGRVPTKTEMYAWAARKRVVAPTGCVMGDFT